MNDRRDKREYPQDFYSSRQEQEVPAQENEFLKDIKQIEELCERYDLNDAVSNKRLHHYLKGNKVFSTWVGRIFLIGLGNRSRSHGYRRVIEKCCKIVGVSFLILAVILVSAIGYQRVQEVKQSAVLEYMRQERMLASGEAVAEPSGHGIDENLLEEEPRPEILSQYKVLVSMYPDVVGWLKVEGTPIDYPVMQHQENEDYYMNHTFQGETDSKGSLFISKDSKVYPKDDNIVIFGHNMKNNSIFGSLDNYLDQNFYKEYNKIEFDTIYEKGTYQIVAVVRTAVKQEKEEGFRYYWLHNYESEEHFVKFREFLQENQVYDTGEQIYYDDEIIMLSTCEYSVDNGRLVVVAKKI